MIYVLINFDEAIVRHIELLMNSASTVTIILNHASVLQEIASFPYTYFVLFATLMRDF